MSISMAGEDSKKAISIRLPEPVLKQIDTLKPSGLYGSTRGEIMRALILDALKDIQKSGGFKR